MGKKGTDGGGKEEGGRMTWLASLGVMAGAGALGRGGQGQGRWVEGGKKIVKTLGLEGKGKVATTGLHQSEEGHSGETGGRVSR